MKKIVFILFSFHFVVQGYGQHRIGDFMAYGNNNGLPASLYYNVFQSSDGYLWIGSASGVVRFDGKRYKVFFSDFADSLTLSDNVIVDFAEDDQDNLWMAGFFQGLSKYNLHTGRIKRYSRLSHDATHEYGINKLFKDQSGTIWIATSGRGLARYLPERDSFELFIPDPHRPSNGADRQSNHITGIAEDRSDPDILWLSCFDGLYAFHKTSHAFQHFIYPDPDRKEVPLNFLAVETDHSDKIWLGTWYLGLMSFDKITHQFQSYPYAGAEQPNSLHFQVLDIRSVDDSTLYVASRNTGLLSFNTRTTLLHPLLTQVQLPDGSSGIDIQRISLTPDAGIFIGGNYYIYQQHKSFNRFASSLYFDYGPGFGMEQIVYDSLVSGYWAACTHAGGVFLFSKDLSTRTLFKSADKSDLHFVDVAIDGLHRIWAINTNSGLVLKKEEDQKFHKTRDEFPGIDTLGRFIQDIESDKDGNLWMGSSKKIFYGDVRAHTLQQWNIFPDEKKEIYYFSLCSGKKQDAWIASDKGLFHVFRDQDKVVHLDPDETDRPGIANQFVKAMTIGANGNAWIGFENDGVQEISATDHTIVSAFNLSNGLPAMQVNQMATDAAGRIWVGTAAGLAVFDVTSSHRAWQLFTREDGIKRDYIDRAIMATSDGKLFFNIDEGISWVDLKGEEALRNQELKLHLVSLTIDGKPYQQYVLPDFLPSVELSHDAKEIRIDYAAMDWLHPARTKYFYRIEGISKPETWTENNEASLTLSGMKPGSYLFRLYAVSGDGIKSKEIQLPLLIHSPFWQRWWFIGLCILGVFSLAYALYRYRIGHFKKLQDMRNTISTNLHDDIGASLSNIHILTLLTERNISNEKNATSYIHKAGDEIQRISESLSDIVWNISPRYDHLDNLFIRMKRYAADMLDGKNISAQLVFPESDEKLSMPMDQRRDFYLIFKEAVNNLAKYAEATTASIIIRIQHKTIFLEVTDNGKGFQEQITLPGNGIQNMKQRAEKWKAHLQITSNPGQGTTITMEMKANG